MTTFNLNSSDDDGTFDYTATLLDPVTVNVTTTTGVVPTVTINASTLAGTFSVNATAGAIADVNEVAGAAGTFDLTANGGTIDANTTISIAATNEVAIGSGGTFIAGSSFLGVLDDSVVTFNTDHTNTDTLVLDSSGGLLNLTISASIGGFDSTHQVINDKMIGAADVSTYSITQATAGAPQVLTFFNASSQSLGSLTFTSGTFNGTQLGSHAIGTGPLLTSSATDGTLIAEQAACYVSGTHIRTARGEVAVENLRIGDLAVTASGALRPIVWLGSRRIDIVHHREPASVRPVRVSAGAFGEGLPRRNLWLSPGHSVAFEGALIPICYLLNNRSIAQEDRNTVEYWHIELDAHDILLAEGLPAESYIDTGNRESFANGGAFIEAHPDFRPKHWADTCLPLVWAGPALAAAKTRLFARLIENGYTINAEADAHIVADGRRIEPIRLSETKLCFVLPAECSRIELRSKVFTPAHTMAESDDTRELGVCVEHLQIDGSTLELDDEACGEGWSEAEFENGRVTRRWTTGATPLPAGARIVITDLAGVGAYWAEPKRVRALAAA